MQLALIPDEFAVCRLAAQAPLPAWAQLDSGFVSVTRTKEELSVVCLASFVPLDVQKDEGWRAFRIEGTLDLSLVGVLASVANPLAAAGVNIFVIATFDTDYFLVKTNLLKKALSCLRGAGFPVRECH